MGRINNGQAIDCYAVSPLGKITAYDSLTEAAKREGYSLQYVHRDISKDIMRKYQSHNPFKRGVRFTTDRVFAKLRSERNKEYINKFKQQNNETHQN